MLFRSPLPTFNPRSTGGRNSFARSVINFPSIVFDGERRFNLDWHTNYASGSTVEFVFTSRRIPMDMTVLESSGSGNNKLWDLRLITSGTSTDLTSGSTGKFEFRLNTSNTGSAAIAGNALSMSTDYMSIKDGTLWNVMLQQSSVQIF